MPSRFSLSNFNSISLIFINYYFPFYYKFVFTTRTRGCAPEAAL